MVYTKDVFKSELLRLAEGISPEILTDDAIDKLYIICEELDRCSKQFNLTAITEPDEVLKKHIIDCLFLSELVNNMTEGAFDLIDVGSGAGFPSLPLAASLPMGKICALDSTAKKIGYIRDTADKMGVSDFTAIASRAEDAARSEMRESYDFACARAVARLAVLMELCVPFVKVGGYFISMKAAAAEEEVKEAESAVKKLGCEFVKMVPYTIADLPDKRFLVIYKKVSKTISTYPRNFSQISKKPL